MTAKNDDRKTVTRVIAKETRKGQDVWRVATSSGRVESIVTRNSSTAAIDEAMTIYNPVLQRLADR
jgi:hypothetical protein